MSFFLFSSPVVLILYELPRIIYLHLTGQVAEQADATASKAVGLRARKGSTPFLPILK